MHVRTHVPDAFLDKSSREGRVTAQPIGGQFNVPVPKVMPKMRFYLSAFVEQMSYNLQNFAESSDFVFLNRSTRSEKKAI